MSAADAKGIIDAAREEGLEQGHKKGLEQGLQEGERLKAIEVAKGLFKLGLKDSEICAVTGLSVKDLSGLRGRGRVKK